MDVSGALADNTHVIRVPEYFYAVDINYLTHMIGKKMFGQSMSHPHTHTHTKELPPHLPFQFCS